ncbi:neuron navigator 3, partial [Biomphalaria glabrata]
LPSPFKQTGKPTAPLAVQASQAPSSSAPPSSSTSASLPAPSKDNVNLGGGGALITRSGSGRSGCPATGSAEKGRLHQNQQPQGALSLGADNQITCGITNNNNNSNQNSNAGKPPLFGFCLSPFLNT